MAKSPNNRSQEDTSVSRAQRFVQLCGRALVTETHADEVSRAGGALTPHEWRVALAEAIGQGMAPIVYRIATQSRALEMAPPEVVRELLERYTSTLVRVRLVEGQLAEILHAFESS